MQVDAEKLMENCLKEGLRDAINNKLSSGYGNPFDEIIKATITRNETSFRTMLDESLKSAFSDEQFRTEIKNGVRHTLAKTLIARFGGELERQVNVLKSDPATRARITLAIEEIVKSKTT